MPKGIPNNKTTGETAVKRLSITLNSGDYEALCVLAQENYRTPDLQAAYLIARVLADAGRVASMDIHKKRLAERASELRTANGAQE